MTELVGDNTEQQAPGVAAWHALDQDWVTLIGRIAQGDQQALGTLYDATSSLVHGLAVRILGNTTMAEEVTLAVYTQVWCQATTYDARRGAPAAWLFMLTRSRALDGVRAQEKAHRPVLSLASVAPPEPPITPEEASVIAERRRLVHAAFAALPQEQREVVERAYFEGLSCSDIATQYGVPLGTVKTRLRLGMVKLRDLLRPLAMDWP